jgi:hypothetical protein
VAALPLLPPQESPARSYPERQSLHLSRSLLASSALKPQALLLVCLTQRVFLQASRWLLVLWTVGWMALTRI